ncbi:NUDIX hydrolase [Streptomyces katsurahamanus]|uniref:NUDIX domain-containing protein n=1 Tax=Streptomyces katsurahamanus TaxID=2577098 RepID=A0ABW9NR53_9ACTN|nr:NUDIX domain-containing protein [Streptomyces katsurahamanus]MQS35793.1 NUDIX domain-containing protein [Streptomyces katsurahamanus]
MLILERGSDLLLAERKNTGYADGLLNLPSGKVEHGEDVYDAIIREAEEEIGVRLRREALRLVHVMYFRNPEGGTRVGWFFATNEWSGEPVNAEPHKCAGIAWHHRDHLPDNTVRYNTLGISHYIKGEPMSVHWHDSHTGR